MISIERLAQVIGTCTEIAEVSAEGHILTIELNSGERETFYPKQHCEMETVARTLANPKAAIANLVHEVDLPDAYIVVVNAMRGKPIFEMPDIEVGITCIDDLVMYGIATDVEAKRLQELFGNR